MLFLKLSTLAKHSVEAATHLYDLVTHLYDLVCIYAVDLVQGSTSVRADLYHFRQ